MVDEGDFPGLGVFNKSKERFVIVFKDGLKKAGGDLSGGVGSKEASGGSEGAELGTKGFGGFTHAEEEFCIGEALAQGRAPGSEGGVFGEEASSLAGGVEMAADAGLVEIEEARALARWEGIEGSGLCEVAGIGEGEEQDEGTGGGQEPEVVFLRSVGGDRVDLVEITGGARGEGMNYFCKGGTEFRVESECKLNDFAGGDGGCKGGFPSTHGGELHGIMGEGAVHKGGSAAGDAGYEDGRFNFDLSVIREEQFIEKESQPVEHLNCQKKGREEQKEDAPPSERRRRVRLRSQGTEPPFQVTRQALEAKQEHSVIEDQLLGEDVVEAESCHAANPYPEEGKGCGGGNLSAHFEPDLQYERVDRDIDACAHGMDAVMPKKGVPQGASGFEVVKGEIPIQDIACSHCGGQRNRTPQIGVHPKPQEGIQNKRVNEGDTDPYSGESREGGAMAFGAMNFPE